MSAGPVKVATSSSTGEVGGESSRGSVGSVVGKEENLAEGDWISIIFGRRGGRSGSRVFIWRFVGLSGSAERVREGPLWPTNAASAERWDPFARMTGIGGTS
jgi:hypothetical protein